jgi:hypothetical protein
MSPISTFPDPARVGYASEHALYRRAEAFSKARVLAKRIRGPEARAVCLIRQKPATAEELYTSPPQAIAPDYFRASSGAHAHGGVDEVLIVGSPGSAIGAPDWSTRFPRPSKVLAA